MDSSICMRLCTTTRKMTGNLTFQEIDLAEKKLLKLVQDESFNKEDNLKGLLTYVDQDRLYRLNTKIVRRDDTEAFRCLIVLPSNHELVHRLILDHHLLLSHAGVQFVLTHLRQRF
ncbi:zinc finger protein GIS2 [Nephila pilipes]|uniref:Zinc finger protein GIS2 n=1 Tax=Nephila pilipes TaxID=299642 RepID=A0A8X6N198_NEPPI|nr:zinc finger protein GIS2 [Nephila pilipes]